MPPLDRSPPPVHASDLRKFLQFLVIFFQKFLGNYIRVPRKFLHKLLQVFTEKSCSSSSWITAVFSRKFLQDFFNNFSKWSLGIAKKFLGHTTRSSLSTLPGDLWNFLQEFFGYFFRNVSRNFPGITSVVPWKFLSVSRVSLGEALSELLYKLQRNSCSSFQRTPGVIVGELLGEFLKIYWRYHFRAPEEFSRRT